MIEAFAPTATYCSGADALDAPRAVAAFNAAYNAHDIAGIRAVISEHALFSHSSGTPMPAPVLIRDWEDRIFPESPELHFKASDQIMKHDLVAQVENFEGGDSSGEHLVVYRVEDGCIVEVHTSNENIMDNDQ